MKTLQELMQSAEETRLKYEESRGKNAGEAWRIRDYAMGFTADLGELMKTIINKENLRPDPEADAKLGNKLSDCLNDIFVIANYYGIDLEKEYGAKLDTINRKIEEKNL